MFAATNVVDMVAVVQLAASQARAQAGVASASSLSIPSTQGGLVASGNVKVPHCALAKTFARPRTIGNSVEDNAQNTEYGLYVRCVNFLDSHPKSRQECAGCFVSCFERQTEGR